MPLAKIRSYRRLYLRISRGNSHRQDRESLSGRNSPDLYAIGCRIVRSDRGSPFRQQSPSQSPSGTRIAGNAQKLGLYANLRPVSTFKSLVHRSPLRQELVEGADFICIRELTGGIYFGRPQGRSEDGQTAFDSCVYTKAEIKRICRLGFEYAMKRRNKLTVVDKANVLATSRLWRETVQEMAPAYPQVNVEYMFVDNAAMKLIQQPKHFDVIVTENMFGDILTDEASVITGSLGLLPSASIGIHTSLFEPIHGSYPQAAGKNVANPLATILSAAMMFEYAFNLKAAGASIRQAVDRSIEAGIVTEDIAEDGQAYPTSEVGDFIAKNIG